MRGGLPRARDRPRPALHLPGARWRRAQNPQEPLTAASIGETFHDWWRLWQTIGGQWAYLGALAVGALLGLALAAAGPRQEGGGGRRVAPDRQAAPGLPPRTLFRVVVLLPLPLIGLAGLAVVFGLRSGYGDVGWTYGRTWTSFLLPLLITLCAYGAWGGHLLGRRLSEPARPARRAAVLVAVGAVAVGSAAALVQPVHALTTSTVVRSVAWDRQNARIREQVAGAPGTSRTDRCSSAASPSPSSRPRTSGTGRRSARPRTTA